MKLKGIYKAFLGLPLFFQKKWLLLGIVLLIASTWRLTNLSLVEFKGDESLNLFLATRPLFGHPFPPASLASSVGILNFPLLNYFLFPIVFISLYPPFVSGVIALVNVLAIGAYFLLLDKYSGRLTAFFTTILLGLAPWAIIYSRKIWAQDFLIPLVVGLLFCFFKIYKEKNQRYWIGFGIFALFLIQIHQTAGILPFLLCFPLIKKQKPHFLFLLGGLVVGLLPTIPYIWYEIANNCPDCTTLLVLHGKLQNYHPDIFLRMFQITTTGDFHTLFGDTDFAVFTTTFPLITSLTKITYLMYLLLPISVAYVVIKEKTDRIFVIITLLILITFFVIKIQPEMHYFIILLPFLFLFIGAFFASLLMQKRILLKSLGIATFSIFTIIFITFDYSFFHFLSQKKGLGGDYGSTYASAENTATDNLQLWKNNSSFKEITLAYYIPKESIMGSTPVGRILYPLAQEKNNLGVLQKDISDPRVFNELIAYYTYPQTETHQNLFFLKKEATSSSKFQTIYQLALGDYLYSNLKQYYTDNRFWMEFPEHWHVLHDTTTFSVTDDIVSLTIIPQINSSEEDYLSWHPIEKAWNGQQVKEYDCYSMGRWCGSIIPNVQIGQTVYTISMTQKDKTVSPQLIANEKKVLDSIFKGIILY